MAFLSILLSFGIVIACVSVHYEVLRWLSILQLKERRWYSNRFRAGLLVVGCLIAHMIEVAFFGFGYRFIEAVDQIDDLRGLPSEGFNYAYYSTVVYTSIGFGDVVPLTRATRILTAVEGLTGAILIAWTASFMFFHMQRFWALPLEIRQESASG